MSGKTTIGIFNDYERSYIITVNELIEEIERSKNSIYLKLNWDWSQFCDFRYNTCLQRFLYDPYTGEKINWKELKNNYKKYVEEYNKSRN